VNAVAFSPDGRQLLTAGEDRTARLWDAATGAELTQLAGHTDYVYSLAFSPDGSTLASGSGDHTVRLWDTVPLRERQKARRELEDLRPEADRLVHRLAGEGVSLGETSARVRANVSLGERLRDAAWHAVLREAAVR
jgi:hypothetical protein